MLNEIGDCDSRSYSIPFNNCGHFATDVVEAGGGGVFLDRYGRHPTPNRRIPAMLGPEFYIGPTTDLNNLAGEIRGAYEKRQ